MRTTQEKKGKGKKTPVLQETTFLQGLSVQRSSQKSLSSRGRLPPLSCPARIAFSPRIPQVSHACVLRSARGIDVAMRRPSRVGGKAETKRQEGKRRLKREIGREFPVNHPILVWLGGGGVCLFACCVRERTHVLESHQCGSDPVTPARRPTAVCTPPTDSARMLAAFP